MTPALADFYHSVRSQTRALTEGLSAEDMQAQSMPDASPVKWHLAHTSWFFETFILSQNLPEYRCFNEDYQYLFNSYYDAVGPRHARPQRGLLTRPPAEEIFRYRLHVDHHMQQILQRDIPDIAPLVTIGLHHEMQHQELILTDVLHLLSCNPLKPALQSALPHDAQPTTCNNATSAMMLNFTGGLIEIGADKTGFSYDCEKPRHQYYLQDFKLANRPVTNAEWLSFIDDGGYQNPLLWLSDGWHYAQKHYWQAPLYWQKHDEQWTQFSLNGRRPVIADAPVCHISYYEADAFARWAGKRLPREQEWELVAQQNSAAINSANLLEKHLWQPTACSGQQSLQKLFGDVWEWTQSPYTPYPGFTPTQGALAEYNGKFMANQFVLRGGSCATAKLQLRDSYRNFFYPHQRWQFSGVRLAEDQ